MPEQPTHDLAAAEEVALQLGLRMHTAVSIVRDGRYQKCQEIIRKTRLRWEGTLDKPSMATKRLALWLAQNFAGSAAEQALEILLESVPSITSDNPQQSPNVLEELFFESSAKGELNAYYTRLPSVATWCRAFAAQVDVESKQLGLDAKETAWFVYSAACIFEDFLLNERAKRIHERGKSHISIANGFCSKMLNAVLVQLSRLIEHRTADGHTTFLHELSRIEKLHIKAYAAKHADGYDVHLTKAGSVREHFENVYDDVDSVHHLRQTAAAMGQSPDEPSAVEEVIPFHGKQVVYSTLTDTGGQITCFDDEAERRFRGLIIVQDEQDRSTIMVQTSAGGIEIPGQSRFLESIDQPGFISSCANDLAPMQAVDITSESTQLKGLQEIRSIMQSFRIGIASILQHHEIVRLQLPNISEPMLFLESDDETVIMAPGATIDTLHAAFAAEGHTLEFIDSEEKFRRIFARHRLHADFPVAGFYLRKKKIAAAKEADTSPPAAVPDQRSEISKLVHQKSMTYQRLAQILRTLDCIEAPGGNGHTTWTNPHSRKKNSFRYSDTKCTGCAMPVSHVIDCFMNLALTDQQMQSLRKELE